MDTEAFCKRKTEPTWSLNATGKKARIHDNSESSPVRLTHMDDDSEYSSDESPDDQFHCICDALTATDEKFELSARVNQRGMLRNDDGARFFIIEIEDFSGKARVRVDEMIRQPEVRYTKIHQGRFYEFHNLQKAPPYADYQFCLTNVGDVAQTGQVKCKTEMKIEEEVPNMVRNKADAMSTPHVSTIRGKVVVISGKQLWYGTYLGRDLVSKTIYLIDTQLDIFVINIWASQFNEPCLQKGKVIEITDVIPKVYYSGLTFAAKRTSKFQEIIDESLEQVRIDNIKCLVRVKDEKEVEFIIKGCKDVILRKVCRNKVCPKKTLRERCPTCRSTEYDLDISFMVKVLKVKSGGVIKTVKGTRQLYLSTLEQKLGHTVPGLGKEDVVDQQTAKDALCNILKLRGFGVILPNDIKIKCITSDVLTT